MAMTCPVPWVLLLVPLHLAVLILEGAVLSLLKLDARYLRNIYLPTFGSLLRHIKALRAGRGAAQQSRCIKSTNFFEAFDGWPHKLRMLLRHGVPSVD